MNELNNKIKEIVKEAIEKGYNVNYSSFTDDDDNKIIQLTIDDKE